MTRRTKIIATIGPTSESPKVLGELMEAGMDVARIGLAHGTLEEHLEKYRRIRKVATEGKHHVGILIDLPGPKVRASSFGDAGTILEASSTIRMSPDLEGGSSTATHVGVDYAGLLKDIHVGDRLTFGDGGVVVEIVDIESDALVANVAHGGRVKGRPGVHIPADRLTITAPTEEDLRLLDAFVTEGVDMVAISFVRSAHDVRRLGVEPHPRGPLVVAKIETRAAVENLEGIIEASGAVMIARGDLGSEMPIEELPHLQKRIVRGCIAVGRPAITATQMLESMVTSPTPTRAEASDVANAVFDGTSVVMLSGETAIGHDPVLAVRTMARLAHRADQEFDYEGWGHNITRLRLGASGEHADAVTDSLTMAAWRIASQIDAKAILCLSQSGFTVRSIARFRPTTKILGFTPDERTYRQLALSWGVTPILTEQRASSDEMAADAIRLAVELRHVRSGDLVILVAGTSTDTRATDTLRVLRVP